MQEGDPLFPGSGGSGRRICGQRTCEDGGGREGASGRCLDGVLEGEEKRLSGDRGGVEGQGAGGSEGPQVLWEQVSLESEEGPGSQTEGLT